MNAKQQSNSKFKAWIKAFRLRTLPLALSSILMGSFLAASKGRFDWNICLLAVLTTLLLQILSNLANDYGDTQNGADNALRKGPERAVQSGVITAREMLAAIILFAVLSLVSGLSLLFISINAVDFKFLVFLIAGLLAIAAAIKYTAGKNPYGYAGLGDVSVFLFFGITGVYGSYYLFTNELISDILLPSYSLGVFSVAVLNLNNMRDILPDTMAGKKTIPFRIGYEKAKVYHLSLLISGFLTALFYVLLHYKSPLNFLFVIAAPLFFKNGFTIYKSDASFNIDPLLKQMALSTLLFVMLFGIGINF